MRERYISRRDRKEREKSKVERKREREIDRE